MRSALSERLRRGVRPIWALGILWISACGTEPPLGLQVPETLLLRATLSDPATLVATGGTAAPGLDVAYVSLPPGSLPEGSQVEVSNPARGVEELIPIAAGGFDPVPIAASAGDVLHFTVLAGLIGDESGRSIVATWTDLVPARRPPIIVRTYPPKGRRDLPVALSVLTVFSEPIDSMSAVTGSIELLHEGSLVPASVRVWDGGLKVTLEPADVLTPNTAYVLRISGELRDQDGDAIARAEEIPFWTGDPGSQAVLSPTALCSNHPPASIPTFADENLDAAVRTALGWPAEDDLTCELVAGLTSLSHRGVPYQQLPPPPGAITSIVGVQNLTGLTRLELFDHALADLGPLAGLTGLDTLALGVRYLTPPTVSNLGPLSGLTGLRHLNLNNTVGIRDLGPLSGLTSLSELYIRFNSIVDLSPLRALTSLRRLNLAGNAIVDVGPLSALTNLTFLAINENAIVDISPLAGLTKIGGVLWLYNNRITDLGPIGELRQVTRVIAAGNSITDVSGLAGLANLTSILLDFNPNLADIRPLLDDPAFGMGDTLNLPNTSVTCDDITLLQAKGVRVTHTCSHAPVTRVTLTTTSLTGASVGVSYSQVLMASGGTGVYTWQLGPGLLPAGLALSPSGVISGVPTAAGTAWFNVSVSSGTPPSSSGAGRLFSVTVEGS